MTCLTEKQLIKLMFQAQRQCIVSLPQLLEEVHESLPEGHEEATGRIRCPYHSEFHEVNWHDLRLRTPEAPTNQGRKSSSSSLPKKPAQAGPNWCVWHETSAPQLTAVCAYCPDTLHVHPGMLGAARAAGKGFLVEKCPHGHHENAVIPEPGFEAERAIYLMKQDGKNEITGAIRTAMLVDGQPVRQLVLVR